MFILKSWLAISSWNFFKDIRGNQDQQWSKTFPPAIKSSKFFFSPNIRVFYYFRHCVLVFLESLTTCYKHVLCKIVIVIIIFYNEMVSSFLLTTYRSTSEHRQKSISTTIRPSLSLFSKNAVLFSNLFFFLQNYSNKQEYLLFDWNSNNYFGPVANKH